MDNFYAEKLWQKAKEQWLIDESTENYEKIVGAFVFGVKHVPKGYVLVPIEPTEEMLAMGENQREGEWDNLVLIYKAMIQAAQEQE